MVTILGTNDFAITNCLFGAIQLTKNIDLDKSFYSRYGIGFDVRSLFSLPDGSDCGKNVILFGLDNSSSAHIYNKKDILLLGKDPTQELDDTS